MAHRPLFAKLADITGHFRPRLTRRHFARIGLPVALALCTSFNLDPRSHAQGFFETLFGSEDSGQAANRASAYRPSKRAHLVRNLRPPKRSRRSSHDRGSSSQNRRVVASSGRSATEIVSPGPAQTSRQLLCVRACDGYVFPIVDPGSVAAGESLCRRLCWRSKTKLFVSANGSEEIHTAVAARDGGSYSQFVARAQAGPAMSRSCSCRGATGLADEPLAVYSDLTLRPGDSVMTRQGVRVFRGASHFPFNQNDFLSLADAHGLTQQTRVALAALEGGTRRAGGGEHRLYKAEHPASASHK